MAVTRKQYHLYAPPVNGTTILKIEATSVTARSPAKHAKGSQPCRCNPQHPPSMRPPDLSELPRDTEQNTCVGIGKKARSRVLIYLGSRKKGKEDKSVVVVSQQMATGGGQSYQDGTKTEDGTASHADASSS